MSFLASIPAVAACVLMLWTGRASDRAGRRAIYAAAPMLLAAVGWLVSLYAANPLVQFIGLIGTSAGAYGALSVFWAVPPGHLSPRAKPAGLALITMSGIMGSIVSPIVIGALRDFTGSFASGLLFATALLVLGACLVIFTPFADMGRGNVPPRPS